MAWPDLRAELAKLGEVESFIWSGKNSHRARIAAGERLAGRIEEMLAENGDERLYVIAHSHGGNVALYGLSDDLRARLGDRLGGIVCMATPFLHFRPQQLDTTVFRALPLVGAFVLFTALFTLWMLGWLHLDPDERIPPVFVVLPGVALCAGLVAGLAKLAPSDEARQTRATRVKQTCRSSQPPAPRSTPVLLLRKAGDEATTALVGGRLVELLLAAMWRAAGALTKELPETMLTGLARLRTRGRIIATILAIGAIALLTRASERSDDPLLGYAVLGLIGVVLVVALVQTLLGLLIAGVNILRFGWSDLRATPFVRVTSEPTPLGTWPVRLYPVMDATGRAHSEIYTDPAVIRDICRWVSQA